MKNTGLIILLGVFILACSKPEEQPENTKKSLTIAKAYICDCEDTRIHYTTDGVLTNTTSYYYSQFLFVKLRSPSDSTFDISIKQHITDSASTYLTTLPLRQNQNGTSLSGGHPTPNEPSTQVYEWLQLTNGQLEYQNMDSLFSPSLGYQYTYKKWHCTKHN